MRPAPPPVPVALGVRRPRTPRRASPASSPVITCLPPVLPAALRALRAPCMCIPPGTASPDMRIHGHASPVALFNRCISRRAQPVRGAVQNILRTPVS
ncbi:hypothetical protein HYPSUDRAFT_71290 [Hypholoma sublateritium FD-334 SS-4]|uniref:Uncharacterized protein n=1 Tax=Hypholoma sublateritium (strain FD-334 SS-4) TaxID=945553 RepID=A0A0D2LZZ9_HYPSF|nr:hypothetical protein HYPSUDRAFT_71290 [Hypholoma sublateritium FD-334 SS-4]